jgi:hypothetical protein
MRITVIWIVMLCMMVEIYPHFREDHCFSILLHEDEGNRLHENKC